MSKTKELEKSLKEAKEVIKFYANSHWDWWCDCCARGDTPLEEDKGEKAKDFLIDDGIKWKLNAKK